MSGSSKPSPTPTPPQPITATESPRPTLPGLIAAPRPALTPQPSRPATSGAAAGGAATLQAAGIEVRGGLLAAEAEELNRVWTRSVRLGRPVVTWKAAATLDGRTAAADGTSQWITSPESRDDVHRLRARCDAIVVGTGTALADDPRLTVRRPGDRSLPSHAHLHSAQARTMFVSGHDPRQALTVLARAGVRHAWLEGGATLAAAFLREGLVDEVLAYLAPVLLGAGRPLVGDLGIATLADALRFELVDVTRVGTDVRLTLTPTMKEA